MAKDHELLGVKATAAPSEIRAAYVGLLKLSHLDIGGNSNAPQVSDLVRAYRRLCSVAARQQDPPSAERISLGASHLLPVSTSARPPASPARWGAIWSLALIGAATAFVALIASPEAQWQTRTFPAAWAVLEPVSLMAAEPDENLARQAVGALQAFGPREGPQAVEAHSRRCFAELTDAPDLRLLDYCIAFDIAATHTLAISSAPSAAERGFFHPAELGARHTARSEC